MTRLLLFVGMTPGCCIGWQAGDSIGLGLTVTFSVSSLGSAAGVYVAWRVGRNYLDGWAWR